MPRDETPEDRDRRRRHRERRQSHGERRQSHGEHYDTDRDRDRERRRRRGHRATDSQGDLLARPSPVRHSRNNYSESEWEQDSPSPRKSRHSTPSGSTPRSGGSRSRNSGAPLSLDALAKLDKVNAKKAGWRGYDYDEEYLREVREKEAKLEKQRIKAEREEKKKDKEEQKAREREAEMKARAREEEKRRAYESDVAAQEDARYRREKEKRRREERERRRVHTDDEGMTRRGGYTDAEKEKDEKRRRYEEKYTPSERADRRERRREEKRHRTEQKKRRVISGPLAEEGGIDDDDDYRYMMEKRGGAGSAPTEYSEEQAAKKKKLKRIIIGVVSFLIILAIVIPVAVMMSKKNDDDDSGGGGGGGSSDDSGPDNSNLKDIDPESVPSSAKGGILDPFSWYDTSDFNVTYTDKTVGGLPVMGLFDKYDDDVQANKNVPKLNKQFEYGKMPIRGVNVGGWLNLEPFMTPSFFEGYNPRDGIVDEWNLCKRLGDKCKPTLEKHYATYVTKQTFKEIREAGFDHVRIPFGYWIVTTYDDDPYVKQVSWRYLLRSIEWARQHGLRVNLDLHGAPGSQNGWNHSGKQGEINWLMGDDGDKNAERTLEIHHQLSQFFAQPRYKNIVTMYGLVNEPRMVEIDSSKVISWTEKAVSQIRRDNITAVLVFGDGFFGLDNWQGKLQDDDNLLLDVHQYVVFNVDQLSLKHTDKLSFACRGWTAQSKRSMNKNTGFGPTMCGEWSQADTDCTQWLNDVGSGTRWEGTLNTGNASTSILKPQCPSDDTCSCKEPNGSPDEYTDAYKKFLYQFAVAQMISFEYGWGWFYWTWDTEKAVQWSWKKGRDAGILPKDVSDKSSWDFDCPDELEDFEAMGLPENYKRSLPGLEGMW